MTREQALKKLKKIKALAERGIGGEKTTAIELYKKLSLKYEIAENEILDEGLEIRWISYKNRLEEELLIQIFYKITGDKEYWYEKDRRRHLNGVKCTEFEFEEIKFLFEIYRKELEIQLNLFIKAFITANDIYPDENTRIKTEAVTETTNSSDTALSDEEIEEYRKIRLMSLGIEEKQIYKQIENY